MSRSVVIAVLLAVVGAALFFSARGSNDPLSDEERLASIRPTPRRGFGAVREPVKQKRSRAEVERRPPIARRAEELVEQLADEPRRQERLTADRERRELQGNPDEPPSRRGGSHAQPRADHGGAAGESARGGEGGGSSGGDRSGSAGGSTDGAGIVVDYSQNAIERALTEAGLPPAAAADIKRRYDELSMEEVSLRNLATREGWVDTPEFAEELDAIETERLAIRDEIGDEAYDHYLFATGQPNRVYVTDVISNSPASVAGLQTSDVIIKYDDARILHPNDLIGETEVGTMGETVRLEITRNGEPMVIEVPRGPLGLQIGVTQEPPSKLAR